MISTADWLTVAGLILDIAGVALLFRFAPEKFPDPQFQASFRVDQNKRERWRQDQRRRQRLALAGVSLLVIGFSLQGVAVFM